MHNDLVLVLVQFSDNVSIATLVVLHIRSVTPSSSISKPLLLRLFILVIVLIPAPAPPF